MKQEINYYYEMQINNIQKILNDYYFQFNNKEYLFFKYNNDLNNFDSYFDIINELKTKNIFLYKPVKNIYNSYLSNINDINYILLEVQGIKEKLSIIDIMDFSKKTYLFNFNKKKDWADLWQMKIDYIENQLNEITPEKIIEYSIDYYIGLGENAITYFNKIKSLISSDERICLSHKRVYYPNYKMIFNNPLNLIFDYEVRDIAEYLKSMFYSGNDAFEELVFYLKSNKLSNISYNLLFIRLLFPSKYFDIYDDVINNNADPQKIITIISKSSEYEKFLKKAYDVISSYATLEKIDWLIY